jgi:hypothetical protein
MLGEQATPRRRISERKDLGNAVDLTHHLVAHGRSTDPEVGELPITAVEFGTAST